MLRKTLRWAARLAAVVVVALVALELLLARPGLPVRGVDRSPPKVSAVTLEKHVRVLSEDLVPRDYTHPENLDAVAEYISATFRAAGLEPRDQVYEVDGSEYRNVIVELGPSQGKAIVLGAHYDTAGEKPGADDNASGIACLLEIGRLLAAEPPSSPVTLVAYTLEEPPHFRSDRMGSAIHARSLVARGVEVEIMISLEMVGYFTSERGTQAYPISLLHLYYPSRGDFITVVDRLWSDRGRQVRTAMSRVVELPVLSLNAPASIPGVDFSDHLNYWAEGFDAVMVTDTAFYRNRAYHTERDTADRLDYERMAQVAWGVFGFVGDG